MTYFRNPIEPVAVDQNHLTDPGEVGVTIDQNHFGDEHIAVTIDQNHLTDPLANPDSVVDVTDFGVDGLIFDVAFDTEFLIDATDVAWFFGDRGASFTAIDDTIAIPNNPDTDGDVWTGLVIGAVSER